MTKRSSIQAHRIRAFLSIRDIANLTDIPSDIRYEAIEQVIQATQKATSLTTNLQEVM